MHFEIIAEDKLARQGRLTLAHGVVETPVFMPVGTCASVKAVTPEELEAVGAAMILANTFHLMLRPGSDVIRDLGGLHRFMHWDGPILTDSGGFQVWSLAGQRDISEDGVTFRSPIDGASVFLSPERSLAVQADLGADVVMVFDECTPYPASESQAATSMERSLRWAARCREAPLRPGRALFGIVQGGMFPNLRQRSLAALEGMGFDGYALGGLSVGEPKEAMQRVLRHIAPRMPREKPRYLMGVGTPQDIVVAVAQGVDMFDCVLPTRNARNG